MRILLALLVATSVVSAEPLSVEIKPATLTWKPKQHVDVAIRVVNTSTAPVKVGIWLCSWFDNFRSTDPKLVFDRWGCDKNYVKDWELQPGKAWEDKLEMYAFDDASTGVHKLQLVFKPYKSGAVFSNEVSITVQR
jgi:hypothetical protein